MISTVLVAHPWLTTVAFVVLVVLGPVAGALVAGRPRVAYALAAVAFVPPVVLTLVPTSREVPVGCTVEWAFPTFGAVEVMANVELFAAPVLLLAVASRRPVLAVLAGSGASFLVEAAQGLALVSGRSCSTNDWLMNTLGAVLGGLLAVLALSLGRPVPAPERERAGSLRP